MRQSVSEVYELEINCTSDDVDNNYFVYQQLYARMMGWDSEISDEDVIDAINTWRKSKGEK